MGINTQRGTLTCNCESSQDKDNIQSRNSMDKEAEINTRAGDKKRMKKLDKEIRKTLFFDKDLVTSDSEMAEIMERLFKEIDGNDGDGALSPEELVELEASLGLTISLEEAEEIIQTFNINGYDRIELEAYMFYKQHAG